MLHDVRMGSFVKQRHEVTGSHYEAEAAGLRWLAVPGGARVARVISLGPRRLEIEHVEPVRPTGDAAYDFGRALARTHAAGAVEFGAPPEGWDGPLYIGEREMPSVAASTWGEFYASGRVMPFVGPALQAGHLNEDEAAVVAEACEAIASGTLDDDAPPARIHGDLWAGNVLFGREGVVLIDPAAHGGHAETDLAMLALFGAPHLADILEGYQAVAPLREGWRSRIPAHQLHPLAVHAVGHGRSYGVALVEAARRTLALVA